MRTVERAAAVGGDPFEVKQHAALREKQAGRTHERTQG